MNPKWSINVILFINLFYLLINVISLKAYIPSQFLYTGQMYLKFLFLIFFSILKLDRENV